MSTAPSPRRTPPWWSTLPPGARPFLLAAALHERAVPAAWAEKMAVAADDIDVLLKRGLLRETRGGFVPGEKLDGTTPATWAAWSDRRHVHVALAQLCRGDAPGLELAARHHEAAGQPAEAARCLFAAADLHAARRHHADAQRCTLAGLKLLPADTPDVVVIEALQQLSRCTRRGREPVAAAASLRDWFCAPPWLDRIAVRAESNLVLADLLTREGRHVESARARCAAARDLASLGRDRDAAEAALAAAMGLTFAAQFRTAQQVVDDAVAAAGRAREPELLARSRSLRGVILGMLGRTDDGITELRDALSLALEHRLTGAAAEACRLMGTVQEYASRYRDEQTAFASALRFCRRHQETHTAGTCLGCLAYACLRSGRWRQSERTARQVIGDRRIPEPARYVAQSVLGLLHAYRGEVRPAARLLQQSLENCRRVGLLLMEFFNLLGLAVVAELQGDASAAANRFRELIAFWRGTDDQHDVIPGLATAAGFFAQQRDRDETAAAAEALDRIAAATANPEAIGAAHAAAAELCWLDGDNEGAVKAFRRALDAYELRRLSVEPIRTRLRLAAVLWTTGAAGEAREHAQLARQAARRLGARPMLARADVVLAGPPTPELSEDAGFDAWNLLSDRQREVARGIARGLTNKEIASQLGVSVRTVDMHVAHVLARLNCRSRAQVAARVAVTLR